MTDEERRTNELLRDFGALLMEPKTFKVVDGLEDLVRFGNRVHLSLENKDLVALRAWRPELEDVFASTIKFEFPEQYDSLILGFRGEKHHGWKWNGDPELLTEEQAQLAYGLTSSLRSLTLDGLVGKLYAEPQEKLPVEKLGDTIGEILQDELLDFLEARQLQGLAFGKNDNTEMLTEHADTPSKKVRFKVFNGITVAESLGFELQRKIGKGHLLEKTGRIVEPHRRHIQEWIEWEGSLEIVHVVPAMLLVWTKI